MTQLDQTTARIRVTTRVRSRCPACGCGYVGHMTAEELKARAAADEVDLSCPVCGLIHLSREEAQDKENERIRESGRYRQMVREALSAGQDDD